MHLIRRCSVAKLSVRLVVLLVLFGCAGAACANGTAPVVQRQEISVTLEPENHLVIGRSSITFAPGAGSVALRLAESSTIESVAVGGQSVPYSFRGGMLRLELEPGSGPVTVTVSYRAAFNDPVSKHPAASEDPSYGVSGAITREGTFLGGGAWWYPVPAQIPERRSISIAAPAGTEAVTAGRRVLRETAGGVTRSVWEEARPVGVLPLCAGPYRVEERRVAGIELYSYLYPDNAALSARYLDAAAKYLSFYIERFGPYPFEKFAVVENFFPTGYGFPSFTLLGGSVIRLPFIVDTSFPHEIAHSWWGNGIDVDPGEGNWAEGLVTYLADYLLKEERSPLEARDYRRQLLIDYASLVTAGADFPLSAFLSRSDPASRAIGYGKGAMLFHMIRTQIGERAFFQALRQVARERMYRSASWSDFVRAFSQAAGRDLAPMVQQWLDRPGGPRLSLAGVARSRDGKGWKVTGTIVQTPPLFELEVPLQLQSAAAEVKELVAVRRERTPFSIASPEKPERLFLDPQADVFRILTPAEIPATVNSIKGSSRVLGVVTADCRAGRATFRAFLASLSQGEAPLLEEAELDRGRTSGSDLVFCGVPRDRSLLPRLPAGIELAQGGFSLDGVSFSGSDALLMLVLQREGGRVAALFQPLSQPAAEQYAPKIMHYGKYGYLAFAGGSNRRKGVAAATDASVAVELDQGAHP